MNVPGIINLHFIEGNIGKIMKLNISQHYVQASAEKFGTSQSFHFYQYNDPKHALYVVKNCYSITAPSPDVNVTEICGLNWRWKFEDISFPK